MTSGQNTLITASEQTSLMRELRDVHDEIARASEGVDHAAWSLRQSPVQWSPAEIVEHVLLVERGLLTNIERHLSDAPMTDWERAIAGKEGMLRRYLPGAGKAQASEKDSSFQGIEADNVVPLLAETLESYSALLSKNEDRPLKEIVWDHSVFGPLNAYLWLLYLPLHSERHLRQLQRLRTKEVR